MTNFADLRTLKITLLLNAVTCFGMGLLLVLTSVPVAQMTRILLPLLFWAGLLLLPVAALMVLAAIVSRVRAWALPVIIIGNALWVAASLFLPISGAIAPNVLGWSFIWRRPLSLPCLLGSNGRKGTTRWSRSGSNATGRE